jgi:hypothetical protein
MPANDDSTGPSAPHDPTVPAAREWGEGLPAPGTARPINPKFRAAWIIWCVLWALAWITVGWFIIPVFNVAMFAVSIAAIYAVERRTRR